MGATTPATERPMFLSADRRKLSYRSKSGRVLTLELKNSKAANSLRQLEKKFPQDKKQNQVEIALEPAAGADKNQGLWPQLFDTLSLYIEEAIEVAAFGPYDDPPK